MRYPLLLTAVCLSLGGLNADAQIYKWTDAQGHLHFGDRPTSSTQNQAEVINPQISTYSNVEVTTDSSLDEAPAQHHPMVRFYSTSWCGVCKQARAYFAANHIPYTEYDVEHDDRGRHDFGSMHGTGVPIILVGNHRMNGFDAGSFQAMYGS